METKFLNGDKSNNVSFFGNRLEIIRESFFEERLEEFCS